MYNKGDKVYCRYYNSGKRRYGVAELIFDYSTERQWVTKAKSGTNFKFTHKGKGVGGLNATIITKDKYYEMWEEIVKKKLESAEDQILELEPKLEHYKLVKVQQSKVLEQLKQERDNV